MSVFEKYEFPDDGLIAEKSEEDYTTSVYLAINKQTGADVIVKCHHFQDVDALTDRQKGMQVRTLINQFRQEPQVLRTVQESPYFISLLDYEEDFSNAKEMFIVMEKAKGISLAQHLQDKGAMTPREFYMAMYFLIEAVGFLHKKGIVHRDLSAANVFVEAGAESITGVQLIDFGLAYVRGGGIRHKQALTAFFAPPESFGRMLRRVEPTYDLYSVGTLMYMMLCNQFPYPTDRLRSRSDEAFYRPIERSDVSDGIKDFIRQCLHYDATLRPRSVVEIKREIYQALGREGIDIKNLVKG